MNDKDRDISKEIFDAIESFDELSWLSLSELLGLQRMVGYDIEEKLQKGY